MIKKYDEPINYKQLSDEEKEELKQEMFNIFCELKKNNITIEVKPKDISNEVLKRFNIVISPQTVKVIKQTEKWDKKLMVSTGAGVIDSIKETIFDDNRSSLNLRSYERELLRSIKVFMGKRFKELQDLADKIYVEIKEVKATDKEFWKGLMNYLMVHDRQVKMLEVIGIDKIMGELLENNEGGIDMNKIIELYEIAQQNAKIIKEMIEKEDNKIINVEIVDDEK